MFEKAFHLCQRLPFPEVFGGTCGRDAGGMATHRLFDNGHPYVCWDSKVRILKEMQTISRVWANSIQEYIATGERFGPQ